MRATRSFVRQASFIAKTSLLAAASLHGIGCSSGSGSPPASGPMAPEETGAVGMQLTLPDGEVIDKVGWQILGPNHASTVIKQGSFSASSSPTLAFTVGGLPVGSNYSVSITATTADSTLTCAGFATFSIASQMTTQVNVLLQCSLPKPDGGTAAVTGTSFNCGTAGALSATPSVTGIGGSISLTASTLAPDPTAVTYVWSAPSGTLSTPTGASTLFTCALPGPVTITLVVGDGPVPDGGVCNPALSTSTLTVQCDPLIDAGAPDAAGPDAATGADATTSGDAAALPDALSSGGDATLSLIDAADGATATAQKVKHVFVIVLENKNYGDTFGTSTQDPYLTGTLKPMGALLSQYYGTGHVSLDNYISMISGQGSTLQTESDCPSFNDFQLTAMAANGQAVGTGCVYPATVKTLPDQLKAAGYTWRGYMEDMGNDPAREPSTCGHVALNAVDVTQTPEAPSAAIPAGDQYAGRHDPFIYFHSIIDSPDCASNVVNLSTLDADLATAATTPNLVFITPNLCDDGHDGDGTGATGKGCVTGKPGGLASSDAFLQTWVPKILASPAYLQDGLLVINFDESSTASIASSTDAGLTTITATFTGASCCNEELGPNVTRPSTQQFVVSPSLTYDLVTIGAGGDQTGAVVISKFVAPGTSTVTPYNHYSLLRSIEDMFGLSYLGFAGQDGLQSFGGDVYTRPNP